MRGFRTIGGQPKRRRAVCGLTRRLQLAGGKPKEEIHFAGDGGVARS